MARGDCPRVLDSRMLLVSVHRGRRLLGHVICSGEVLRSGPFMATNGVKVRVITSFHHVSAHIRRLVSIAKQFPLGGAWWGNK